MEKSRLLFSGSGGQGVITAAILMADSSEREQLLNAVQTQSYGAAARGGATRSDLIIWDKPIYFPKVIQANVLICLTQEAFNKYQETIRPGGWMISDSSLVKDSGNVDARRIELPLYETVMDTIGKSVVLNICMLGAVATVTGLVRLESIKTVIAERFGKEFRETNFTALDLGAELVRRFYPELAAS
ncbi:MAG: 2-oxoacid:acceptor oxidoreductase family protein [Spirochaetales bacterium]|jgi:2-oxoglutarate ferredoxin oxidoreductase subunit gamma|nr:2-oxoacid:acceptor oxidoreductase family protein [Spirochaetales bacterium]